MPKTKSGIDAILTTQMKADMDNASYCQPTKKPGNDYVPSSTPTATGGTTTTPTKQPPAKSGNSMIGFNFLLAIYYMVYIYLK